MIEVIEIDGAAVSMAGDYFQTLVYCKSPNTIVSHIGQAFVCDEIVLRNGRSTFM
jgi:L-serine dehydratase